MTITIRQATTHDVDAIVDIIENCFGDEVESQPIQAVIKEDDHATFVAEVDGNVIGFVDNFITLAQDGTRRCELDLLGVDIHHRGQGVGKKLVEASTQAGRDFGASQMRVLVAATNTAMYHTMLKMDYQPQNIICRLYVSSADCEPSPTPATAHLIPVNTLTYRGIWLEGEVTIDAIKAAQGIRTRYAWDTVGAVIPTVNDEQIDLVETANFTLIGSYYYWHKAL